MAVLSSLLGVGQQQPVAGPAIATTAFPAELAPYYKDILSKAQALYEDRTAEGYQPYQGPTIAEFTPEQQQVQAGIAGLVGSGAPAYQEAMGMTREAATPYTAAQVEEYMSPYQQAVTDIEKREAQKQFESQVVPELAAKAAMAQPFGGSRASGTNDKAGSEINLLRWVSVRTIKENFDPPSEFEYPFLKED